MRIFEFIINPDDLEMGMKAISLVDRPAIESEYIAFNKQEKKQVNFIKFQDEKKYIVAGLALIPDKLIYRVDEFTEEEYLGYFSAETIEMIVDKFMKEAQEGTTKNVNFQHNPDVKVNAHLIESFILRTPEMVEAIKAMGIEDAVLGAWFVSYKFDSKEDYENAVNGGFTGYSIEVILQRELKLNNIKNKNNIIMTKFKNFVDKFKSLLSEMETSFEDIVVPDTGKALRIGEVGQPVLWVWVDEEGAEQTEPTLEGEYILEDGRIAVVDAQGNLMEIKDGEVAPIPEEEMAIPEEEKPKEVLAPEGEVPAEAPAEMPEEAPVEKDVASKTLGEIIDVSKDGEYIIKVVVAGGAVTEATVEAAQDLIKKADFDAVQTENVELKEKLEKLEIQPAFVQFTKKVKPEISKEDLKKLSNLELTKKRLGLA